MLALSYPLKTILHEMRGLFIPNWLCLSKFVEVIIFEKALFFLILGLDKRGRKVMKHIAVVGAGCVGSVIIERLLSSDDRNYSVSVVANGSRAERLRQHGLTVNGKTMYVTNTNEIQQNVDLLFVCVKNYDLEKTCEDLKQIITPETIILPLLNSISPTPFIKVCFPQNRVLYGYITKIDSFYTESGFQYNIPGDIHFGFEKNSSISDELQIIKRVLENAGFHAFVDQDMKRGIWRKWMLNVGANQVSALTEANYLEFARIPEIEKILRLAMQELLTIACYENVDLGTRDIIEILDYLTTYPYPKETSMLQDIKAHRRTEIDYISGDIIELSHKWNCPCPVNLTMYYLIKSKEKCYIESN